MDVNFPGRRKRLRWVDVFVFGLFISRWVGVCVSRKELGERPSF